MGPMLPRAFAEAGLPVPALMHECPVGGGPDFAVEAPTLDGLAERIRDEAVARQFVVWGAPLIGASVRKP